MAASATFTDAPVAGVSTPVKVRFWRKYSAAVWGMVVSAPPPACAATAAPSCGWAATVRSLGRAGSSTGPWAALHSRRA